MDFLNQFEVILLDLCDTFMFGVDRFSENEDYFKTYRQLGGDFLKEKEVKEIVEKWFGQMMADYGNPSFYNAFPKSRFYIDRVCENRGLPEREKAIIEELIAVHESGTIQEPYISIIKQLKETHRLGLVSNIWSEHHYFTKVLKEVDLYDLFEVIIFSSDCGIIKPSKDIFEKGLNHFDCSKNKVVYIGDSLECDVRGGKNAGIATVWISYGRTIPKQFSSSPNFIIEDLRNLA